MQLTEVENITEKLLKYQYVGGMVDTLRRREHAVRTSVEYKNNDFNAMSEHSKLLNDLSHVQPVFDKLGNSIMQYLISENGWKLKWLVREKESKLVKG